MRLIGRYGNETSKHLSSLYTSGSYTRICRPGRPDSKSLGFGKDPFNVQLLVYMYAQIADMAFFF